MEKIPVAGIEKQNASYFPNGVAAKEDSNLPSAGHFSRVTRVVCVWGRVGGWNPAIS